MIVQILTDGDLKAYDLPYMHHESISVEFEVHLGTPHVCSIQFGAHTSLDIHGEAPVHRIEGSISVGLSGNVSGEGRTGSVPTLL